MVTDLARNMRYISHAGDEVSLTMDYVREQFCPDATPADVLSFMAICQSHKLNPILKEVYMIKYQHDVPAQIVLSYWAWLQRATMDANYQGFRAGVVLDKGGELAYREGAIVIPGKEKLLGGWSEVLVDGRIPVRVEVGLSEYEQNNRQWKRMPATMIRKVAVKQAHQLAFPSLFQGLAVSDELAHGQIIDADTGPMAEPDTNQNYTQAPTRNVQPYNQQRATAERRHIAVPPNLHKRIVDDGISDEEFLGIIGVQTWREWIESGRNAVDAWTVYEGLAKSMADNETMDESADDEKLDTPVETGIAVSTTPSADNNAEETSVQNSNSIFDSPF